MGIPNTPLSNIRVLDLGRFQAGPRCGLVLARLGAEVIKIEKPGKGDRSRDHGPYVRGQSAYWVQYNSGKKSLTLDTRSEEGKFILSELVKVSDILIQNFRPGTMDKMGFGYNELKKLNKGIIMVNISAYGQFGPYWERIGFDQIGQALSGHMSLTGEKGMPPIKTYAPVVDRITALHGAIAALAALWERNLSGEGQTIDVSLADSGYSLTEIPVSAYRGTGYITQRTGNRYGAPPNGTYPTKDGWVLLVATGAEIFHRLCTLMGKEEWIGDDRFSDFKSREAHLEIIDAAVTSWTEGLNANEIVSLCAKAGVPSCPVNSLPQAAEDPHPWERNIMTEVDDPIAGKIAVSGDYFHYGRSDPAIGSPPTPGQHTDQLLKELLSFTDSRIEELRSQSII